MAEPDNPVLEHLRAIRGEMGKLSNWMETMSTEMTAMRHHLFGAITTLNHDHVDIAEMKVRLDRIEKTAGAGGLMRHVGFCDGVAGP